MKGNLSHFEITPKMLDSLVKIGFRLGGIDKDAIRRARCTVCDLHTINPFSIDDMNMAYCTLKGEQEASWGFRLSGSFFGEFVKKACDGADKYYYAASSANIIEWLVKLIQWYKESDLPPLIKSLVFEYEFERIRPFEDCNERMGELWRRLLLGQWDELFYWIPTDVYTENRRDEYFYSIWEGNTMPFGIRDTLDSTLFIELMLEIIRDSLWGWNGRATV